jgi:hypothetical protein
MYRAAALDRKPTFEAGTKDTRARTTGSWLCKETATFLTSLNGFALAYHDELSSDPLLR